MSEEMTESEVSAKGHSDVVTKGIRVRAAACYMENESDPTHLQFFYGYRIQLENVGETTVQLLSRHWVIVDAQGDLRQTAIREFSDSRKKFLATG